MKKIVLNINDVFYEKLKFEALYRMKTVSAVIRERLTEKPFDKEVEEAYEYWMEKEIMRIAKEEK